ncbi:MAG: LLM class flavin-dependent oxidoreductase [Chitinophagales bacterium]|nr:LLM class flavin-dependent oxidoreductase [Chitinophagales bacterium]
MIHIPLSVLELAIVNNNTSTYQAIENSMIVAQKADELGFSRIWFAEHHNSPSIASSATALLIQLAASKTSNIRVGSGGVMLPNHSPLVIAEQFGTLETLYPGRIDLGLGRAPGTDQLTAHALRRDHVRNAQNFPTEVQELQRYFKPIDPNAKVHAHPGEGLDIPIWILGSSTDSAYLAAEMGLPYAFAMHFAPTHFFAAAEIYKSRFKPSAQLDKPYFMACVNIIAADTDDKAHFLATSFYNMFIHLVTGQRQNGLMPPGAISEAIQNPDVKILVDRMTGGSFIGSPETIGSHLQAFIEASKIDELMFTNYIFDMEARLNSMEIIHQLSRL